ncbi:MAG: carbohydrate kinase family protein [Chloroflexi bacterium]|nr:carbohydrate kinase family protein [Chloroflexota bacterium]MCI0575568.1 carbohydrate kinase family protein [Chloroflexota bacterium]MCI0649777.1 carbohydrate kinase family protein [Chloroflexota bacterium]
MVLVLGDLIADLVLHIPSFPVSAQDLQRVTYLELGPGGATNVAITAAHFGLAVGCLGEVGDDPFGAVILDGLRREGVDVSGILVNPQARTPLAAVIVDESGEPAYLGFRGSLQLAALPPAWPEPIRASQALFADGWVEYAVGATIILEGLQLAHNAGVPTFFDPGPGNPTLDNNWHLAAAAVATILLATEEEAHRLTGLADPAASARALLDNGSELVVVKRGAAGCLLVTRTALEVALAFPVQAVDATGAGDSLAGAVIYGYLQGLSLPALGLLANATGAAKVQKRGTGHNMPTRDEVQTILEQYS